MTPATITPGERPPPQPRTITYSLAAWAFVWVPCLLAVIFYALAGLQSLGLSPLAGVASVGIVFAGLAALAGAVMVVARSGRASRWWFVALNSLTLLVGLALLFLAVTFSGPIYQ